MRFSLFVNLKGAEIAAPRCFVECNVGRCTVPPVLDKGAEVLYPFFSTCFVCRLTVGLELEMNRHCVDTYLKTDNEAIFHD